MPPVNNTNNNIPGVNPLKIGLDPVFKGNQDQQISTPKSAGGTGAFDVLNNQNYTPGSVKTNPYAINLNPEIKTNVPKSIVRTFRGDVDSIIQTNHLSSINIAIAESQKRQEEVQTKEKEDKSNPPSDYSRSKIIIFISIILIVLGLTGIFTLYILNTKNTDSQIITKNLPSLITTEAKEELDVNSLAKKNLPAILANKLNDTIIPTGNFYNLYLTTGTSSNKKLITATDLINLTGLHMPDLIKRTLQPTFMLGAYSLNKNIPLLIIKTSSFENTYAGMLTWEKDLERDFQILFRLPGYENRGGILAELTPTIDIKNFQDGVIINKDVRLLNNDAGQLIMLYSIIDKETIIITTNKEAFKEIVNRLNKEKGLQR